MTNTIAVMNTKGGVGKSTIVLALAETLSALHGKNVLVIDSDAQASASSMLMTVGNLYKLQADGLTIVDYLVATVLNGGTADWPSFVVRNVSDVDDARTVFLIPSDMQLTLFEREVSKESQHARLRASIAHLLAEVSRVFDIVLIDCPPGLSVLTECWLREASFHLSPTKADYVSVCGLEVFRRFKALNPEMGFAENLGVIVNMKDMNSSVDEEYHRWLRDNAENRCFNQAIPRLAALQDAARFVPPDRSFVAKYPGQVGMAIRVLTTELLARLEAAQSRESGARSAASTEAGAAPEAAAGTMTEPEPEPAGPASGIVEAAARDEPSRRAEPTIVSAEPVPQPTAGPLAAPAQALPESAARGEPGASADATAPAA